MPLGLLPVGRLAIGLSTRASDPPALAPEFAPVAALPASSELHAAKLTARTAPARRRTEKRGMRVLSHEMPGRPGDDGPRTTLSGSHPKDRRRVASAFALRAGFVLLG